MNDTVFAFDTCPQLGVESEDRRGPSVGFESQVVRSQLRVAFCSNVNYLVCCCAVVAAAAQLRHQTSLSAHSRCDDDDD